MKPRQCPGKFLFLIVFMIGLQGSVFADSLPPPLAKAEKTAVIPSTPEEALKKEFPNLTYQSINPTGMEGVYEIIAGENIFYYHPQSGNLIIGEVWNSGKSLTADRKSELGIKKIKELPLDKAIKIGSGLKEVIEISDPDCPFCRQTEDWLRRRTDITRYVFLFPVRELHPDAEEKAKYILCSPDPSAAYEEVMKGSIDNKPFTICNSQSDLLKIHKEAGTKLGAQGTPTFIVQGTMVVGADIQKLEKLLNH